MPVTAKRSQNFYERLGDDIANELVNWFNMVDETYRMQLRELNELNFARFDAKMEERFAKSDAKWEERFAKSDAKLETRFAELDAKWETRFAELDAKWEVRFAQSEAKLEARFAKMDARLLSFESDVLLKLAAMETTLHRDLTLQMRWMIGALLVQTGAIISVLVTVLLKP